MSSKKVFYHGFNDIQAANIVKNLRDLHDWEPVYMCGADDQSIKQYLGENNIRCTLQSSMKLRQAQFDYTDLGNPAPIDSVLINKLSNFSINYLGFMQDSSGWNYSFEERKHFYYDILKYWNTVLNKIKPDIVIFFTWPHTSSCYPLYLMCKHHFDIDVLFIDPTPLLESNAHFIGTSLESLHSPFMKFYESKVDLLPSPIVAAYLSKIRGKQAQIPQYIKDVYTRDKKTKYKIIEGLARLIISTCVRRTPFKRDFEFKKNKEHYTNLKSRMNTLDDILFSESLRRKNRYISKVYNKLSVTPDYNKKYLYFAAPYQPEAGSAVNAGFFEDVFVVLDILSATIPDDWIIYYKEHPGSFLEGFRGSLKRSEVFYKKVCSYKNIEIISSSLDTFKLIDASQAVSSIAGTVGWESVVRGKPTLSFGNGWYHGCKSVFKVNTVFDAKNALAQICDGWLPDIKDVDSYAASVELVTTKYLIHDNFHEELEKANDPLIELKKITDFIFNAYQKYFQ